MNRFSPTLRSLRLILLLLLLCAGQAKAAQPLVLSGSATSFRLGGAHLDIFEDTTGRLTIADVTSPGHASSFKQSTQQVPGFGLSDSAFWFRFTIDPGERGSEKWLLFLDQPVMDEVDLYIPQPDGTFALLRSGDTRPEGERAYHGRDVLLPLPMTGSPQTCYLRTWVPGRASFPLSVMTEDSYRKHAARLDTMMAGYAGFMVAMTLLGLLFFFIMKERNYLLYALYLMAMLMTMLMANGYLGTWLSRSPHMLHNSIKTWLWCSLILTGAMFARSFLQTARRAPRHDLVLKWGVILISCMALFLPTISPLLGKKLINTLQFPLFLAAISAAVMGVRQGFTPAVYFLAGRFMLYTGGIVFTLANLALVPVNLFTTLALIMLASLVDIIFLALGLGESFRVMRKRNNELLADLQAEVTEKSKANRALEEQIVHRRQLEREIVKISDDERRRMSHELHDGLCQQLTGARLRFAALDDRFSNAGLREEVGPLGRLLDETVDHAYRLSRGLWSYDVGGTGALLDLGELTRQLSEQYAIPITLQQRQFCRECSGENLPQVHLIAREAIMNALKHSRASQITVSLECDQSGGSITLEVSDDGIGIDGTGNSPGNMGISIMKHRAEIIGGTLRIEPGEHSGTRVFCNAPCREGEQ